MESTKRRYFLGANWKCNGSTLFIKDIITHLINTFEYDTKKMGKSANTLYHKPTVLFITFGCISIDLMVLPGLLHISLVSAMVKEGVLVGA
jgi:hypothetical protein